MKISGIYKIINKINGKYYVGSSLNIKTRWYNHNKHLKGNYHPNEHLQSAWNKYNKENFEFVLIEKLDNIDNDGLLLVEQKYLDIAKMEKDKCYNKSFLAGRVEMTDEIKKKISISHMGDKNPFYGNHSMSGENHPMFGKRHTEETKLKMKNSHSGNKNHNFGKKIKNKTKKLISEKQKLRLSNVENRLIGKFHPNYDDKEYKYFNTVTNELFTGTKYSFYKTHNLLKQETYQLTSGKRKKVKNWTLIV